MRGLVRAAGAALVMTLCCAVSAQAETVSCTGADTPLTEADRAAAEQAVVCLVDRERASRGLPRLAVESRVAQAARAHAQDMATRGYFSHDAPPPAPPTDVDRLRAAGYEPSFHGETIGQGWTTPRKVVNAWLHSRLHCSLLLSAAGPDAGSVGPADIGVGTAGAGGGAHWVMLVALEAGRSDAGYPGSSTACPIGTGDPRSEDSTAAESAEVQPFVRHEQRGGGNGAPAGGGGDTGAGGAGGGKAPGGGGGGTTNDGTAGQGTTTTTPAPAVARLHDLRAKRTGSRIRVSGRLQPGLSGRIIRITLTRGGRKRTTTVRTGAKGRFASRLRPPAGRGKRVSVRVSAVGTSAYGAFTATLASVRLR